LRELAAGFFTFMLMLLFIWFSLYYTKLGIGSPPKDYYVQVDTGSDILWVNCVECSRCPKKSDLGVRFKVLNFFLSLQIQILNRWLWSLVEFPIFVVVATDRIDSLWSEELWNCTAGFLWPRILRCHVWWSNAWVQVWNSMPL